jgi:diguanylate cyclase (GGDEF)-like protein
MRVVIVDDDTAASQRLSVLLRRWGYDPMIVHEDWHSQEQMLTTPAPATNDHPDQSADAGALQTRVGQGQEVPELRELPPGTRWLLQAKATRDALTGLWGRAMTLEILNQELARGLPEDGRLSVIVADLDRFQRINDTLGRSAGDEVLRQTARRLLGALRPYDIVGRHGDEFLIVLPGCAAGNALVLAERLCRCVAMEPVLHDGRPVPVAVSLGVAGWDGKQRAAELLRTADAALCQARNACRNQLVCSDRLPVTCWPAG